ncbi:MAG: spore coat U domain-containing protein [Pseudomonadota bacterium]|nr:spore coat U domain-containing protein [Pseudomonadota bacterium]
MASNQALLRHLAIGLAALVVAALVPAGRAEAAVSSCSISSSGVAFSPYDSQTRAAVDGAGTITVTCTGNGFSNNLSLHLTGGSTGSCSTSQMRNGSASLGYQIYRDASRLSAFCDGSNRLDISLDFSTGPTQVRTYTMFGRVLSGQNAAYGSYSDTLTVTLKQGGSTLATTTAAISGSVAASCTVSAGTLGFGTYSPSAASLSTANLSVNCSSGAPYQVGLEGGQNASGGTRRMAGPAGSYLGYELYSNAARTAAWGNGTSFGSRVAGTGTGAAQSLTVHGRIPAGQSPAAGSFADSVIVTVEY